MAEYQLTSNEPNTAVIRTADGACIPSDPANRDWVEYQAWLEAGGVPDPYVPPEPAPPTPPQLIAWSDMYEALDGVVTGATSIGQLGWDSTNQPLASAVFIATNNSADSDISTPFLVALQPGRVLRIEARDDASKYVAHTVVSAELRTDDIMVIVTERDSAGGAFVQGDALGFGVYEPSPGADPTGLKLDRRK